jgi:hypothetical protein
MYQPTIDATAWILLAPGPAAPSPLAAVRGSHIIVLTHAEPGAGRLGALLTGHPSLACTAGSGVLQLCEQAASTWRSTERTGSSLSTLAAASVRAMTGSLIAVIKSQEGGERWCEVSAAPVRPVHTFLQIYPETKVVCLHRNCADTVHSDTGHADTGHADTGAASRWHTRTESMLALERDHPGQCLRVRYEDLLTSPAATTGLLTFLGLDRRPGSNWPGPNWPGTDTANGQSPRHQEAILDAGQIGPRLLEQINRLHAELRYPALGRVRASE